MTPRPTFETVEQYISSFPDDVQKILRKIRTTIRSVMPDANETISYGIPTFKVNGKYVIYFAGFAKHVSVYPIFSGDSPYKDEVAEYLSGKGTAKFPLNKPIPYDLIKKIANEKLKERLSK